VDVDVEQGLKTCAEEGRGKGGTGDRERVLRLGRIMFSIELVGPVVAAYGELANAGRITLGDWVEDFTCPLSHWSRADYQAQWIAGARRLVAGDASSCFVTAMRRSPDEGSILLWPAYRDENSVHFQQKLVLPETVLGKFDPLNPYAQVGVRHRFCDDATPISEWDVPLREVADFLHGAIR
jgi:hypothetical protein